jgi:hypothetical protein
MQVESCGFCRSTSSCVLGNATMDALGTCPADDWTFGVRDSGI